MGLGKASQPSHTFHAQWNAQITIVIYASAAAAAVGADSRKNVSALSCI